MSIVKFDANKIMRDKTVVHCRTKEQAKNLCFWADSIGKKWYDGDSFLDSSFFKSNYCYNIKDRSYGRADVYDGYTILSYEDALLTFPRKMLVWDDHEEQAVVAEVHAIIESLGEFPVVTVSKVVGINAHKHAKELPETPAEQYRDMTHAEVFKALRDGAVVRDRNNIITNCWVSVDDVSDYEICYSYTESDTDVWQKMEIKK